MAVEELPLNQSLARQTAYALLTSMETDLRSILQTIEDKEITIEDILGHEIYSKTLSRREKDSASDDRGLLHYLDFGDTIQLINKNKRHVKSAIAKFIAKSTEKLERLPAIRNRVMHSRPLEFEDLPYIIETCRNLLSSQDVPFQTLRFWYERIRADPTSVIDLDIRAQYTEEDNLTLQNLPVPDFDETGFLGRSEHVTEIKKLVYSNWPVITIVGEGGIGKTALALKVAYEVLDDEANPFDAIIWSSSKTTVLSANDIVQIDGAIKDSIGLFTYIDEQLNHAGDSPLENVIEYMNSFNILLILDNLETVLDTTIRDFLIRIRSSSKVLITSRIGLGELETRYQLDPLTPKESVSLLRATAKSRRMLPLANANQADLQKYSKQMYGNPAFIKWFVSAVQSGKRPEDVVANPDKFLEFCMSNVIEYLDTDAKALIEVFLIYPGFHSPPVLAHLADFPSDKLQRPLQQLLTTNILKLSMINREDRTIASYEIADLPRAHLVQHFRPSPETAKGIIRRKQQLISAQEKFLSGNANKYALYTLTLRSRDDAVLVRHLTNALKATRNSAWEQALSDVAQAKGLGPDFFESYRVEAFVYAHMGNYAQALESYLTAIDLAPRSAPLRYWYAGFLLRHMNDAEAAEEQLRIANKLDKNSSEILNELSRSLTYQHKYAEAEQHANSIVSMEHCTTKALRIAYDGLVQISVRRTQFTLGNEDYAAALASTQSLSELIENIPSQIIDQKIIKSVEKILSSKQYLINAYADSDMEGQATAAFDQIEQFLKEKQVHNQLFGNVRGLLSESIQVEGDSTGVVRGRIKMMKTEDNYGFITGDDGRDYFFHRGSVAEPTLFVKLQIGDDIRFRPTMGDRGRIAKDVCMSADRHIVVVQHDVVSQPAAGETRTGYIYSLQQNKGYCFIRDKDIDGLSYFAHGSSFDEPRLMMQFYKHETLVKFVVVYDEDGRPRAVNVNGIETNTNPVQFSTGKKYAGTIKKREITFAFVHIDDLGDVFLHQNDFTDPSEWEICFEGSDVEFRVRYDNDGRLKAKEIRLTSRM